MTLKCLGSFKFITILYLCSVFEKSRKTVYYLLALNKQISILWYYKNFLRIYFSKYFHETFRKFKKYIYKILKKVVLEKVQNRNLFT